MWNEYKNREDVPVGKLCLFEVYPNGSRKSQYQTSVPCSNILIIGGRFYYDWGRIVRWKDISNLI